SRTGRRSSRSGGPVTTRCSSRTATGSSWKWPTCAGYSGADTVDLPGGHLVARTLKEAGVRHLFTLCGGHILPIYDGCLNEGIQVVDMRHQQAGGHAGDGDARVTHSGRGAAVTRAPWVTDAAAVRAQAASP